MTRVILDAATREKLCNSAGLVEICDESGHTVGFFGQSRSALPLRIRSPFSDEDIQKFRAQEGGRPLAEILRDLGAF